MRSRRTLLWKDRKFNTVLQGSCGFGGFRQRAAVMGPGRESLIGQTLRGPVVRSRRLDRRVLEARILLQDAGAGLTAPPRGIERVRILAVVTARALGPSQRRKLSPRRRPRTAKAIFLTYARFAKGTYWCGLPRAEAPCGAKWCVVWHITCVTRRLDAPINRVVTQKSGPRWHHGSKH